MQSFWKLLEDAYGADYYAFCDQDDVWLPKKVERGVFALEKEIDVTHMSAFDARLFGRVSELLLDVWLRQNDIKYVETGFVQIGNENWRKKIKDFLSAKFAGRKYDKSK